MSLQRPSSDSVIIALANCEKLSPRLSWLWLELCSRQPGNLPCYWIAGGHFWHGRHSLCQGHDPRELATTRLFQRFHPQTCSTNSSLPFTWAKSRGLRVRDAKMPSGSRYRSDEAKNKEKTKPHVQHEAPSGEFGFEEAIRILLSPGRWTPFGANFLSWSPSLSHVWECWKPNVGSKGTPE